MPDVVDKRSRVVGVRVSRGEHESMEARARQLGYRSVGDYVRHLHEEATRIDRVRTSTDTQPARFDVQLPRVAHSTPLGRIVQGDSRDYMRTLDDRSIPLIMTSPPFGLVRKKAYGNEDATRYLEWFRAFAAEFYRVLRDDGSLVIDVGGAWQPGRPTRSLYHFKLLIMLCEEFGFHLAQEHYWWNPAKLPSPAEWVNVRRIRVKDAVNTVWWLSKTPYPRADNRRVLAPYSPSMRRLMENGYTARMRPSGHDISSKFGQDHGGSVPPNLLAIANTESTGAYQEYCRANGIPIHPARFPAALPEYFIRFLTDPGDEVLDPFGGSCVTGRVAETLGRRWTCVELDPDYVRGGIARFTHGDASLPAASTYSIQSPAAGSRQKKDFPPLHPEGGRRRS